MKKRRISCPVCKEEGKKWKGTFFDFAFHINGPDHFLGVWTISENRPELSMHAKCKGCDGHFQEYSGLAEHYRVLHAKGKLKQHLLNAKMAKAFL